MKFIKNMKILIAVGRVEGFCNQSIYLDMINAFFYLFPQGMPCHYKQITYWEDK